MKIDRADAFIVYRQQNIQNVSVASYSNPVCTHLSLIIVCNSRIWSFKGSSLSCGPMLSWLTWWLVESLRSEFDRTAGLLLANRTCFIGSSWPLLMLFICWLWHGILSYLLTVLPQMLPGLSLDRATHLLTHDVWQRRKRVLPCARTLAFKVKNLRFALLPRRE